MIDMQLPGPPQTTDAVRAAIEKLERAVADLRTAKATT